MKLEDLMDSIEFSAILDTGRQRERSKDETYYLGGTALLTFVATGVLGGGVVVPPIADAPATLHRVTPALLEAARAMGLVDGHERPTAKAHELYAFLRAAGKKLDEKVRAA